MLTSKQSKLLKYIRDRLSYSNVSPSFQEMMDDNNISSKSQVFSILNALEERGLIKRIKDRKRAITLVGNKITIDDIEVSDYEKNAVRALRKVLSIYPEDVNDLGVPYLHMDGGPQFSFSNYNIQLRDIGRRVRIQDGDDIFEAIIGLKVMSHQWFGNDRFFIESAKGNRNVSDSIRFEFLDKLKEIEQ